MSSKPRPYPSPATFRLGADIAAAMHRLFERDGISPSEQVRRALAAFLEKKGVLTPAKRTRKGGAR